MTTQDLEQQAVSELEAAGFFVQREVQSNTLGKRTIRVDVVAWSAAENGELAPDLVVEVKRRPDSDLQAAATMLGFYLPVIGAKRAYVYNGKWHLLAEDGESLTLVGCPQPAQQGSNARAPLKLVEELVRKSLGRARGAGRSFEDSWQTMLDSIVEGSSEESFIAPQLSELWKQPQNGPAVAEAMIASLDRLPSSFTTPRALQTALVRLLTPQNGWLIADPFCGHGTLLSAVHRELSSVGRSARLIGGESNPQIAANADKLLRIANVAATVRTGDSLETMPATNLDGVITAPPFGMRLLEPRPLALAGTTRDATLLAVDRVFGSLADGGRAVMMLAPTLLSAGGIAASFRNELAARARVVSVIEIATSVLSNTAIHPVVLVFEKGNPADTLVARLERDWEEQLSEGGAFMKAYRERLGVPT